MILSTEAFSELLCSDRFVAELQLVEDSLEGEADTLLTVIRLRGHLVHSLPQQVREVQHLHKENEELWSTEKCMKSHLKQTVHVARGPLVLETHVARVFLGVPADSVRRVRVDLDLECDGVVLDVSLVRVADLGPGHVVGEAPVVLLAVEHVGDLPGELVPAPRVKHPQVRGGVAGPGRVPLLQTALEEEANSLYIALG